MYLDNLITLNWGNLPNRTWQLDSLTLITGHSGSGKTTLADALQTLLTGGHQHLLRYNVGQEEVTQRSQTKIPRTLASYVVGADDTRLARPRGAICYLVGVFRQSPGEEALTVSALLAVRATVTQDANGLRKAKEDGIRLITAKNVALCEEDIVQRGVDGANRAVDLDEIVPALAQRYGREAIQDHGSAKEGYLRHLWGLMKGGHAVNKQEAMQAVRTFVRAMAYRPIHDLSTYIAEEVLEKPDLMENIQHISDMLKDHHDLRRQAESIRRQVEGLSQVDHYAALVHKHWYQGVEQGVLAALVREHRARETARRTEEQRREAGKRYRRLQEQVKETNRKLERMDVELEDVQQRCNQNPGLISAQQLDERIHSAARAFDEQREALREQLRRLEDNRQAVQELFASARQLEVLAEGDAQARLERALRTYEGLGGGDIADATGALWRARPDEDSEAAETALATLEQALTEIDAANREVLDALARGGDSFAERVARRAYRADERWREQREKLETLDRRIGELEQGRGVAYPRAVRAALERLGERLPESRPRVLCDSVEVTDESWQSAVEGLLDRNRFLILVDAGHEARASEIIKGIKGASVVQTRLAQADAAKASLPEQSVVHLLRTEDTVAEAYLRAFYGTVRRVETGEELARSRRGVMRDGRAAAGYRMFDCALGDEDLVFGERGRERQRLALEARRPELSQEVDRLRDQAGQLNKLRKLFERLQPSDVAGALSAMREQLNAIRDYRHQRAQLDLGDARELEAERKRLHAERRKLKSEHDDALVQSGEARKEMATAEERLSEESERAEAAQAAAEERARDLEALARQDDSYDGEARLAALRDEAVLSGADDAELDAESARSEKRLRDNFNQFREAVRVYNQSVTSSAYALEAGEVLGLADIDAWQSYWRFGALHQQARSLLKRLTHHVLAEKEDALGALQQKVNTALTADFCSVVYDQIRRGEYRLKRLSQLMERHHFSEERYRFTWDWVPHMKRYYDLFERLTQIEGLGESQDLFDDATLGDDTLVKTRDELFELLMADSEQHAQDELRRLADYRNYRTYDILRDTGHGEPSRLSKYGTGSGAQLETPAYIIRMAAMANAYRQADARRESNRFKLVLIDESFAKMDEARAKEVLSLLHETGGYQVIFIMPSRAAGPFYDQVNTHYTISKATAANAPGELGTLVHAQRQVLHPDRVRELWQRYRAEVRQQAELEFAETKTSTDNEVEDTGT